MKLNDKVSTAWSNLGRRKVRTALTSVGVVVGIMTVVTMVSLVNGVQLQVKKQFEKIGLDRVTIRPATDSSFSDGGFGAFGMGDRTKLITDTDVARWKSWPEVEKAIPEVDMPFGIITLLTLNGKTKPVRVQNGNDIRRGPFAEPSTALAGTIELPEGKGSIVLNKGLLKRFGFKADKAASLVGQNTIMVLSAPRGEKQSYPLKIVGVSSDSGSGVQISALDRVAMKGWWTNDPDVLKEQGYDSVTLRCADVSQAKIVVAKARKEKYNVQSIDALLEVANRIFTLITIMLALASSVALLVASIGIVNTMIMSIYERTREIGTLKAMGASRNDIRQMFMIEAGLIGLLGGSVGLVMSWLLGRVLNHVADWFAQRRSLPIPDNLFVITPTLIVEALFFAGLIGVLAGLYPANRAAMLDPLRALRHD